jgi:hypothetical protein
MRCWPDAQAPKEGLSAIRAWPVRDSMHAQATTGRQGNGTNLGPSRGKPAAPVGNTMKLLARLGAMPAMPRETREKAGQSRRAAAIVAWGALG